MKKRIMITLLLSMIIFTCIGCTDKKESAAPKQFIVIAQEETDADDMAQKIMDVLKKSDQSAEVEQIELSESNKYIATIIADMPEDEIVSVLKEQDWIKSAEVNYELTMY